MKSFDRFGVSAVIASSMVVIVASFLWLGAFVSDSDPQEDPNVPGYYRVVAASVSLVPNGHGFFRRAAGSPVVHSGSAVGGILSSGGNISVSVAGQVPASTRYVLIHTLVFCAGAAATDFMLLNVVSPLDAQWIERLYVVGPDPVTSTSVTMVVELDANREFIVNYLSDAGAHNHSVAIRLLGYYES